MTVTYGNRIDTKDSDISECVLSDFEQSCSISHINLSVYPAGSATGEFNDQRMILLPASIHVKFDVGAMRLLVDPFFSMDKLLAKEHNRKPNAVRTDNKNKDLDTKIFVEISQVKSRILSPINTIHSEIDSASGLGKICTYYEDTTTNIATRNDINKVIRKLVSLLRLEHTSNGVVVSVIGTIPTIAYQTTPWPNSGTSNVKFGRPAWMLDYDSDEDFRSDSNACFDDDAAKDDTIVGSSDQLEERGSDFEE